MEAKDTTEPAGDKVDTSGDADEPSNIILSVSMTAGEIDDTSGLTRVDVGDPNDVEFVDEFVEEPATTTCPNRYSLYCISLISNYQVNLFLYEEHQAQWLSTNMPNLYLAGISQWSSTVIFSECCQSILKFWEAIN
jgi:hypothetical protein